MDDDLLALYDAEVEVDSFSLSPPVVPATAPMPIDAWVARVRKATSQTEIFQILDDFRPLDWSDQQRAQMSKAYLPRLDRLNGDTQK